MLSTYGVWGHGEESVAQRRQIVNLWHLTTMMDSDCNVDLIIWVNVVTTLFFV